MRRRLETAISLLLALAVIGVGCGICLLGTLAARGDLSWTAGGARYRLWLIREREGAGLALSQTAAYRGPEGVACQRTRVWFWLWAPRMGLQEVSYEECSPSGGTPRMRIPSAAPGSALPSLALFRSPPHPEGKSPLNFRESGFRGHVGRPWRPARFKNSPSLPAGSWVVS